MTPNNSATSIYLIPPLLYKGRRFCLIHSLNKVIDSIQNDSEGPCREGTVNNRHRDMQGRRKLPGRHGRHFNPLYKQEYRTGQNQDIHRNFMSALHSPL